MTLKNLGFLESSCCEGKSILAAIGRGPSDLQGKVVKYLTSFDPVAVSPSLVSDFKTGDIIGALQAFEDGEWAWNSDIPYYVERYIVLLPRDFYETVLARPKG